MIPMSEGSEKKEEEAKKDTSPDRKTHEIGKGIIQEKESRSDLNDLGLSSIRRQKMRKRC